MKESAVTFLRTLWCYTIMGVVGIFCFVPCFVISFLPASWRYTNKLYYGCLNLFYRAIVWGSCVPLTIKGLENMPAEPAIVIANHQSAFDIPFLGILMHGYPHVWLFLKRFAHIPILGFIARRMNVAVDITNWRTMLASLNHGVDIAQHYKAHLVIFPEGGRAIDDKVHKFFSGFAIIARKTQRPVVPVMMYNLNRVYPPGSFFVHKYPVTIIVGPTYRYAPEETEEEFVARLHMWFDELTQR